MVRKPFLTEHFLFCHTFRILTDKWGGKKEKSSAVLGMKEKHAFKLQQQIPLTRRSSCTGCRSARSRAPCFLEADVNYRLYSGEFVNPKNGQEVVFHPVQIPSFKKIFFFFLN